MAPLSPFTKDRIKNMFFVEMLSREVIFYNPMKVNVHNPWNDYYTFSVVSYRISIYVYVPHIKYTMNGSIVMVCMTSMPHRLSYLIPVSGVVWEMLWHL